MFGAVLAAVERRAHRVDHAEQPNRWLPCDLELERPAPRARRVTRIAEGPLFAVARDLWAKRIMRRGRCRGGRGDARLVARSARRRTPSASPSYERYATLPCCTSRPQPPHSVTDAAARSSSTNVLPVPLSQTSTVRAAGPRDTLDDLDGAAVPQGSRRQPEVRAARTTAVTRDGPPADGLRRTSRPQAGQIVGSATAHASAALIATLRSAQSRSAQRARPSARPTPASSQGDHRPIPTAALSASDADTPKPRTRRQAA